MTQRLHFWSNFVSPFLPEDDQNQKKKKSFREKLWPSVYTKIEKAKLYLLSPLREKYKYFLSCLGYFFGWKKDVVKRLRVRIKIWHTLLESCNSWTSFAAIGTKEYSSVKFNPNFQVWLLLWLPRLQVWKKWVEFIPLILFFIS